MADNTRNAAAECDDWRRHNLQPVMRFDVNASTFDLLTSELVVNPPINVTELLDWYNTTLKQLVVQYDPVVTVTSYYRPTVTRFDQECSQIKTKTRHLDKKVLQET